MERIGREQQQRDEQAQVEQLARGDERVRARHAGDGERRAEQEQRPHGYGVGVEPFTRHAAAQRPGDEHGRGGGRGGGDAQRIRLVHGGKRYGERERDRAVQPVGRDEQHERGGGEPAARSGQRIGAQRNARQCEDGARAEEQRERGRGPRLRRAAGQHVRAHAARRRVMER